VINKRKIIMDVDTGTDDAVALVMAMLCRDFELLGICSVNGNLEVKLTTDNSLRVVDCCEMQDKIKVYKGCEYPLVSTLSPYSAQSRYPIPRREGKNRYEFAIHSDHLPLPEPTITEEKESAVVWLIRTLLDAQNGEITLIPVGPMTNIATAIRADPRIISKIKEIVLMGGSLSTHNASPVAEFNIWADPEAMEILIQSGCKITMIPLDATHTACISKEQADKIAALGTKPAKLVSDIICERIAGYAKRDPEMEARQITPLHDALAICYVLHPEVITDMIECTCHVDISGGRAYGQTVLDLRGKLNIEPHNCMFALKANKDLFFNWIYEVLEYDKNTRAQ